MYDDALAHDSQLKTLFHLNKMGKKRSFHIRKKRHEKKGYFKMTNEHFRPNFQDHHFRRKIDEAAHA